MNWKHQTTSSRAARLTEEVIRLAQNFMDQYYASIKRLHSRPHEQRWKEVLNEIKSTGSYELRETELIFGAKLVIDHDSYYLFLVRSSLSPSSHSARWTAVAIVVLMFFHIMSTSDVGLFLTLRTRVPVLLASTSSKRLFLPACLMLKHVALICVLCRSSCPPASSPIHRPGGTLPDASAGSSGPNFRYCYDGSERLHCATSRD